MKNAIFEGVDGSGKTTLFRELNKATNYAYATFDRAWVSCLVYNEVHRNIFNKLREIPNNSDFYYILCVCDPKAIHKRKKDCSVEDLTRHQEMFKNVFRNMQAKGYRTLLVDTSRPIKECITQIIDFMEKDDDY